MEKTDFSFWDNFSCKEYMDYINNIVFTRKCLRDRKRWSLRMAGDKIIKKK